MECSVELRCNRCARVQRLSDAFYLGSEIGSPVITLKNPCPSCGAVGFTVLSVSAHIDGIVDEEWPEFIDN